MVKVVLILRGHIRDSFKTLRLLNFVTSFVNHFGRNNCEIFIHTWNISEARRSWRTLNLSNVIVVNEELITNYFKPVLSSIKNIIIDDDIKIKLVGSLNGMIFRTPCPKLGWKNMWYGNYVVSDYVQKCQLPSTICVNMRIDLFDVKFTSLLGIDTDSIIVKTEQASLSTKPRLEFFKNKAESYGIDNIYIGTVLDSYKLANEFNFNLDAIHNRYIRVRHQEFTVPYVASSLRLTVKPIIPTHTNTKLVISKDRPRIEERMKVTPVSMQPRRRPIIQPTPTQTPRIVKTNSLAKKSAPVFGPSKIKMRIHNG